MAPPKKSDHPLLDLLRSLLTVERSRQEFVTTHERHLAMLNDLHRERERAFDMGLYVTDQVTLNQAFDHVELTAHVTPDLQNDLELDKQFARMALAAMRDVIRAPDHFKAAYYVVARSKGSKLGFFQEMIPKTLLQGSSAYVKGRILDCLVIFGVTHPELSGAMAVQERLVALLGHLVQHRDYRQAVIAAPGSAANRVKALR